MVANTKATELFLYCDVNAISITATPEIAYNAAINVRRFPNRDLINKHMHGPEHIPTNPRIRLFSKTPPGRVVNGKLPVREN